MACERTKFDETHSPENLDYNKTHKIRPVIDYQSLQTGFLSGQLNASLNSRELAMVSCMRH
jgi:hypothetical protein